MCERHVAVKMRISPNFGGVSRLVFVFEPILDVIVARESEGSFQKGVWLGTF